jgi:cytochrome c oxidase assembly protein subunit 11
MKKPSKISVLPSVLLSLTLLGIMTTGVVYSPTLYRLFCAATGYGGATSVNRSLQTDANSPGVGRAITVRFDTNVSSDLDWSFKPEQRHVETHIGLPTTVFFLAKNLTDKTITARATFNVTPDAAGYYFTKVQCFCFTEEKLAPGESARMPVVFYVDPDMMKDTDAQFIHTITLSYTFFRQSDEKTASARPLNSGSQQEVETLKTAKDVAFEPVEVRRQ